MANLRNLKGSIVALVTPFHEDGSVNFQMLTQLLEFQIREGTDAILVLGTTGESPTMTHEEDDQVVAHTVEVVAGRVPVIVGTGSNATQTMLEKSLRAQAMGADGLLLNSPYYNKTNVEGMYQHFATVADSVKIPCILYNVPGRTGCAIPVSVVERLSKHPNVCGIKEASGDMGYAMKIAHCISPEFALYTGNDDIVLPMLSIGGSGTISVCANIIPKETHDIVVTYLAGNHEEALAMNLKYLKLMNDLFMEVNPIPVKTAMNMMGMEVGPFRLPLWEMDPNHREALRNTMMEVGLL
ncbi:4-hydroxy-tetrahydrodipicolinate synthase [Bengtsoniella intestinalis]|uniref:4-hydroxy-tetrahydrodipicolinate synthase n=1 Tax=Bengtsoniella intestinalis TaxID=3073143 RepID=UPI00391EF613